MKDSNCPYCHRLLEAGQIRRLEINGQYDKKFIIIALGGIAFIVGINAVPGDLSPGIDFPIITLSITAITGYIYLKTVQAKRKLISDAGLKDVKIG